MAVETYFALFASALLAATIVPFSSEVALGAAAASGEYSLWVLLLSVSTGNVLGSVINWLLGRFCLRWQDRRWFPIAPSKLASASRQFNRFGVWSLLFAWVPVIGDPLTVAAGVLRVPFGIFLTLVTISKVSRYLVVLGVVDRFML